MRAFSPPTHPSDAYLELIGRMEVLEGTKLSDAIPKSYFEPRIARSMGGFLASYALYAVAVASLAVAPHPLFYPALWFAAGLGGWGLHCIGHDCGHGSFARSKWLNSIVGHLSLLPLLYPFHAWRHVHNMHHAATNSLEQDTDWRPVDPETFKRMPLVSKIHYMANRTVLFWLGTTGYWLLSGWRPGFFPQRHARREVLRSIAFVILAGGAYLALLFYFTGFIGCLIYFVGPWLAIHMWFSMTTLMQHTSEDLPFLVSDHWGRTGSRILLTTDFRYPQWLHFLTQYISVHTAHHVAPKLPCYNLQRATLALKDAYPGLIRERDFTLRHLWRILTRCHLYDPRTGYYVPFLGRSAGTPDVVRENQANSRVSVS
jgi:acyl-lipid omega-6 desaturase (Delta-12 desaturase)